MLGVRTDETLGTCEWGTEGSDSNEPSGSSLTDRCCCCCCLNQASEAIMGGATCGGFM